MTLSKYTTKRLVVLSARTSAHDAARAMEDNHVGAVLVHEGGELIGIVTDRDLALHVVGGAWDGLELPLSELIDGAPAVLPVTASVRDAAQLMRERHVRRIPIVDGANAVGMITLDDLIAEQAIDRGSLAEIVRAQLAEPGRLKPQGQLHPTRPELASARAAGRRSARAAQTYGELVSRVLKATGLLTREHAQAALDVVVAGLVQRIGADEARQLLAELPAILRERHEHLAHGPDRGVTMHTLQAKLVECLDSPQLDARAVVLATCSVLSDSVSAGEMRDVRGQLPEDMRAAFSAAAD